VLPLSPNFDPREAIRQAQGTATIALPVWLWQSATIRAREASLPREKGAKQAARLRGAHSPTGCHITKLFPRISPDVGNRNRLTKIVT
jgi:hypothetical protein